MMVNIKNLLYKRIVVDTSVLVKLILLEQDREIVKKIFLLHKDLKLTLLATPLIYFEFLNVLSNRLKNPNSIEKNLKKLFNLNIGIIDVKYGYLRHAIKPACEKSSVSFYDSSYHSLAKEVDGIFLTADKKYYEAMKNEGSIILLSNISI